MYGVMDNGFAAHNILPVFVGVWSSDGMKVENNREMHRYHFFLTVQVQVLTVHLSTCRYQVPIRVPISTM